MLFHKLNTTSDSVRRAGTKLWCPDRGQDGGGNADAFNNTPRCRG